MEYLHHSSIPATKSELDLFTVPATQTAIESSYEVEIRPNSTLDLTKSYEFNIPPSDDFTDLSSLRVYAQVKITQKNGKDFTKPASDAKEAVSVLPSFCENFAHSLFEQVNVLLNGQSICTGNNLYAFQAFIEDLFFRHKTQSDTGANLNEAARTNKIFSKNTVDFIFRLHNSMTQQDRLLLSSVPITLKLIRSKESFPTYSDSIEAKITITKLSIFLKRYRLYPDVEAGILSALEKAPAKYFITRNEIKSFAIASGLTSCSFENVFSGTLPRRVIVGFVDSKALNGDPKKNPFAFKPYSLTFLAAYVDGVQLLSIAYSPDHENHHFIRDIAVYLTT